MSDYDILFTKAREFHGHVCPGIVLGTRLTLAGLRELGMNPHEPNKDLIVFMEIDRCGTDAVQAITGCSLGHRSLKFRDYGKFAATFVDIGTGKAVRVAVNEKNRTKHDQMERSEVLRVLAEIPEEEILTVRPVIVQLRKEDVPGIPSYKTTCTRCGEQIMDHREVVVDEKEVCRSCAEGSYYQIVP
jgi:formylmethanofuran dehydrogenase subunit E